VPDVQRQRSKESQEVGVDRYSPDQLRRAGRGASRLRARYEPDRRKRAQENTGARLAGWRSQGRCLRVRRTPDKRRIDAGGRVTCEGVDENASGK